MIEGLFTALEPLNLLFLCIAVAGGVIVGCLPGLTANMGTALLIPFTFQMEPASALVVLAGLYAGAMYGDAVPAILVNVPGTPSALATAFDGYPMTLQGRGQEALIAACYASGVGATIGGVFLLVLSPPLARASLAFGPPEFFWLGVFALTMMGSVVGKSFLRGLGGGTLGILISTIGVAPFGGGSRFTLGFYELTAGISIPVALIGLFAIPQLISLVENRSDKKTPIAHYKGERGALRRHFRSVNKPVTMLRSTIIGAIIGILPGSGASLAGIMSYNEATRWSRNRDQFGKGAVEGVVATETANNTAAPTSMIPLLTLGIPGSGVAALTLGALLYHGLRPGPALYANTPDIVHGFAWAAIFSGAVVFGLGLVMSPFLVRVLQVPMSALVPGIGALTVVGSFAVRNSMFDVYLMFILGIIGYLAGRVGIPVGAIALGIILGPIVEAGLGTTVVMTRSHGFLDVFILRPISGIIIGMTLLSIIWTAYSRLKDRRTGTEHDQEVATVND